jgi:GTPase Era involved in 16S rRNA processing
MNDVTTTVGSVGPSIEALESALDSPSPNEAELLAELRDLGERFAEERLQLAVIGQFKRGKSSLLNALIGEEVLPSGVLPVTAIPTFLEHGDRKVTVRFADGRREEFPALSADELRETLKSFVSEAGNPHNERKVRQVEVRVPSPLLRSGMTMIDTPGVGSTFEHNTRAAEAALPHADVALFVLSPDPPVTKVEIEYLRAAREHAARLIIVLNKCDLLTDAEREETVRFAGDAIKSHSGVDVEELLCVSARAALAATERQDAEALDRSGIMELQRRLVRQSGEDKGATLAEASRKKTARLLDNLALENEVALRSLELPIDQLAQCAATLERSMEKIALERQRARDLLAGDRKRLVERLRTAAEEIGERIGGTIYAKLDQAAGTRASSDELAHSMLEEMMELFAGEFPALQAKVSDDLKTTLTPHVEEAERIADEIRSAATDALGLEIGEGAATIDAKINLKPAWHDRRVEIMSPVPPGALDWLLPPPIRRRRELARVRRDIEAALVRNVEKLRWSLQQAAEASFRAFQVELDRQLDSLKTATAEAVRLALRRREDESSDRSAQITARSRVRELLSRIRGTQAALGAARPSVPENA